MGMPSKPATMLTIMMTAVWLTLEVFETIKTTMLMRHSMKDMMTVVRNIMKNL